MNLGSAGGATVPGGAYTANPSATSQTASRALAQNASFTETFGRRPDHDPCSRGRSAIISLGTSGGNCEPMGQAYVAESLRNVVQPWYHETVETQAMTIRLPKELYELLRREAFEKRVSQSSIIINAVAERLGYQEGGEQ